MSKRKGVSADEKRTRMLELFYEKKEFFQLKELEKIAPKEKGIVAQSVKDVIQGLVDDNLVDTDKIGTSIYYWAYPSKAINEKRNKVEALKTSIEEGENKIKAMEKQLQVSKAERMEDEKRSEAVRKLAEVNAKHAQLTKELKKYSHADPEVIIKMQSDTEDTLDATNRWTDNVFSLRSWCKKNMGATESTFNQQFGIPAELDYVENSE